MRKKDISLILLAAGKGLRYGGKKQFEEIEGKPIIYWSFNNFTNFVSKVYITVEKGTDFDISLPVEYEIVIGGKRRQDSVWNALKKVTTPFVIIHDGVRPLVSEETIKKGISYLDKGKNAIPAIPVRDTLRKWEKGRSETIERENIYSIQTPQFFITSKIKKSYEYVIKNNIDIPDDAAALEITGVKFEIFEGDPENIKITYKKDTELIRCMLKK